MRVALRGVSVGGQQGRGISPHRLRLAPQIARIERRKPPAPDPDEVAPQIREKLSQRRQVTGKTRDQDPGDRQLLGDQEDMHRPRPAEAEQREVARVEAAMDRDLAHRAGHLGDRDPERAVGEPDDVVRVEGGCEPPERRFRQRLREPQIARQRAVGGQPAEDQVGVGNRRLRAAAPVAGRAGNRAGALRADFERAVFPDPGDRPAAGADGVDVELRHLERIGVDLVGVADPGGELVDQRHVRRGAAHVEGDAARNAGHLADPDRSARPADRAGEKGAGGEFRRLGERHRPAIGPHDADRRRDPPAFELGGEGFEIVADHRREIGVEHAGGEALELPLLANHLGGLRDGDAVERIGEEFSRPAFVDVVGVGVDEADRHRLAAGLPDALGEPGQAVAVELGEHRSIRRHAFADFQAPVPRHQRPGAHELDVEQPADQPSGAADLDGVAEPFGGHQRGLRALAFEQRVGGDGGAVHEDPDRRAVDAELGERVQHAAPLAARQGGHLGGKEPLPVEAEDVREGPAHVHPDAVSGLCFGHIRSFRLRVKARPRGRCPV